MADKGKKVMSAEDLRREYEEEQERRRIQELIDSWWATQEDLDPKPSLPEGASRVTPIIARFPSHPLGFTPRTQEVGSSSRVPPAPGSPIYTPSMVITDWVNQRALDAYCERKDAPDGLGPWYRLDGGHIRFHFGTPWALIDREEQMAAQERANARAEGIMVLEQPHLSVRNLTASARVVDCSI